MIKVITLIGKNKQHNNVNKCFVCFGQNVIINIVVHKPKIEIVYFG